VVEGQTVTVHYDPMLSKVIARGATRDEAHSILTEALRRYEILGVHHNIAFLRAVVAHPAVRDGRVYTQFIEDHLGELTADPDEDVRQSAMALAAFVTAGESAPDQTAEPPDHSADPWDTIGPLPW
jgi:acetyl/propionyl-CoA carboxylase alpha subunit